MRKIKVLPLFNGNDLRNNRSVTLLAAKLTQHGASIKDAVDFLELENSCISEAGLKSLRWLLGLPHPTLQKLDVINIAIVGASRRFLAQITRHQDGVKFISASQQYSDYSGDADFVVPYELIDTDKEEQYLMDCNEQRAKYEELIKSGIGHDSAAYMLPQSLRNVLIISATPYEWKHMISQRICRRNTDETRYVMLCCWALLREYDQDYFGDFGPFCMDPLYDYKCREGKMSCKKPIEFDVPEDILEADFPKISKLWHKDFEEDNNEN